MRYIFCIAVFSWKFILITILLMKWSYVVGDVKPYHTALSKLNFIFLL